MLRPVPVSRPAAMARPDWSLPPPALKGTIIRTSPEGAPSAACDPPEAPPEHAVSARRAAAPTAMTPILPDFIVSPVIRGPLGPDANILWDILFAGKAPSANAVHTAGR